MITANNKPPLPDEMSAREVARRMGYTLNWVYQLARRGDLPRDRAGKRGRLYFSRRRMSQIFPERDWYDHA